MEIKYISYLRQSTTKQEISGLGIEAQREIIEKFVSDINSIISEYVETESGRKSNRPKLQEALSECRKTGAILIVAKLDRLCRNVAFTSQLLENDVEIKFCDFPEANKLVLHIISSIAEYEAQLVSIRTKSALRAKRERGATLGKPENLLCRLTSAVEKSNSTNRQKALDNPQNRQAIAHLRLLASQGLTLTEMSNALNNECFTTPKQCQFNPSKVRKLLVRYGIPRL